MLRYKIQTL